MIISVSFLYWNDVYFIPNLHDVQFLCFHSEDKEEDNAYIELKFNDDLKPHLLDLKQLFSQYNIQNIIYLRSVYSFKMYEWIKSNAYLGKWEVSQNDVIFIPKWWHFYVLTFGKLLKVSRTLI